MPRKTDVIKIGDAFLKRSSKLLPCQKEMVVYWNDRGYSTRKLAEMFNVSRRLIQFILDPGKHEANLEKRRANGGSSIYYDKDYHREKIKEHRNYKKNLFGSKDK